MPPGDRSRTGDDRVQAMGCAPSKGHEELDPELLKPVRQDSEPAMAGGTLPRSIKLQSAMALEAGHGEAEGVVFLARSAMQAGATRREIDQALRAAHHVSGAGGPHRGRATGCRPKRAAGHPPRPHARLPLTPLPSLRRMLPAGRT